MIKFLCVWLIIIFASIPVYAAVVGQTDDPMIIGGGARPLGMGRAFTAVAEDTDTIFINPAGLASLKGPQAMSMFTNLMGEVYYTEFCGAIPANFGTVGVGYIATGVNQVPTLVDSQIIPSDYYDGLFVLSYSTPLARFFEYSRNVYVGTTLKIFSRGWSGGINPSASGWSGDFGIKFVPTPYLSFGVSRQNFIPVSLGAAMKWSSGAEEALAGLTKLGIAVKPKPLKQNLLLAFDVDLPAFSGRPVTMHFGTEWKIDRFTTLRGGFDQSVDASSPTGTIWNPTLGISVGYSGFRVDYAYHPFYNDPALATTYISLSYIGEPWLALKGEFSPLIESPRSR